MYSITTTLKHNIMNTELSITELKQILSMVDHKKHDGGLNREKYNRMNYLHNFILTEMKESGKTSLEIKSFFEQLYSLK